MTRFYAAGATNRAIMRSARSRGGLTTKTHALVDGRGRPLVIALTPGQAGDSTALRQLLAELRVPRLGPGRPRSRPDALRGDKAYSAQDHKNRNVVERAFNHLKNWRGLATRYNKHALVYRGGVVLASILLWLS